MELSSVLKGLYNWASEIYSGLQGQFNMRKIDQCSPANNKTKEKKNNLLKDTERNDKFNTIPW